MLFLDQQQQQQQQQTQPSEQDKQPYELGDLEVMHENAQRH
jgi:hypothetical protein